MVKSDYVKSEISLISRFSSITLLYQLLFLWWCVHPSDDPLWHQQLWSREVSDVKANHLCLKFIVSSSLSQGKVCHGMWGIASFWVLEPAGAVGPSPYRVFLVLKPKRVRQQLLTTAHLLNRDTTSLGQGTESPETLHCQVSVKPGASPW